MLKLWANLWRLSVILIIQCLLISIAYMQGDEDGDLRGYEEGWHDGFKSGSYEIEAIECIDPEVET